MGPSESKPPTFGTIWCFPAMDEGGWRLQSASRRCGAQLGCRSQPLHFTDHKPPPSSPIAGRKRNATEAGIESGGLPKAARNTEDAAAAFAAVRATGFDDPKAKLQAAVEQLERDKAALLNGACVDIDAPLTAVAVDTSFSGRPQRTDGVFSCCPGSMKRDRPRTTLR